MQGCFSHADRLVCQEILELAAVGDDGVLSMCASELINVRVRKLVETTSAGSATVSCISATAPRSEIHAIDSGFCRAAAPHDVLAANQQTFRQIWPFLRDEPPALLDWFPWGRPPDPLLQRPRGAPGRLRLRCWLRGWVLVGCLLAGVAGCRLSSCRLIGRIAEPGTGASGGHPDAGSASSGVRELHDG
jgi:hypothetical protein